VAKQCRNRTAGKLIFERYRVGDEVGGEAGERLKELEAAADVRPLSREEMAEVRSIVEEHTEGAFFEGPDFNLLGVTDPEAFLENFFDIGGKAEEAYRDECFFEAISLRLLALDFVLRAYVVYKSGDPIEPYSDQETMKFGRVIWEAEEQGLPEKLVADLQVFNKKRNAAIHHYLLGRTSYQEIGDAYRDADGLFKRIITAMDLPPMTVD
jgi:hypothetical protein